MGASSRGRQRRADYRRDQPVWLKTPVAPFAAARIEQVKIDIECILAALRALQDRAEHVVVEGAGGWLVPIRADYFVSDLAAEMKLPVLVVAQNRLGCLNHTAPTVRSIVKTVFLARALS
jgi:dethiobiotin synthetase